MADYLIHKLGPLDVPGLRPRHVRVYVPPRDRRAPSPVLYMFDGQNVFDDEPSYAGGWYLHRAAHRLAGKDRRGAPVIVGVDHGGEARIEELSPWPSERHAGRVDALLDWIVGALVPRLRGEFHVAADPGSVGIGGSSMGGLAALYAHLRNPETFGLALAMSPSLWIGRGRIFEYVASRSKPWTSRIYLDAGALEAGGSLLAAARKLAAHLGGRGWDEGALRLVAARRGTHSEKHWRRRAPKALEFLFPAGKRTTPQ
jgi:predicted alpha/beta superfamily hydrolase